MLFPLNKTNKRNYIAKPIRKTKKMNCSPMVAGKTAIKSSCLTPNILQKIKEEYNKDHLENPIVKTEPTELWYELHERLNSCDKEECWLNEIKDRELRKNIKDEIFAPKQPPEWKKNRNEWLSNYDILDVIRQYEKTYPCFKFIGPSFIDFDAPLDKTCVTEELCYFNLKNYIDNKITKIGVIFNLDKHNQSGSHWVSLFIDLKEKFIFYFDSAGSPIPKEIETLVKRIEEQANNISIRFKFYQNHPLEHQYGNTECGMYSLFFIITMLTNRSENKKFKSKQDKINIFKRKRIPDKYVEHLRDKYFNK